MQVGARCGQVWKKLEPRPPGLVTWFVCSGSFGEAITWQPNYFGGDGRCVPDHPFRAISAASASTFEVFTCSARTWLVWPRNARQTALCSSLSAPWEPCLVRHFNSSVPIPNMVDVAIATSVPTLEELSSNLLQIVSYVRAHIGRCFVASLWHLSLQTSQPRDLGSTQFCWMTV